MLKTINADCFVNIFKVGGRRSKIHLIKLFYLLIFIWEVILMHFLKYSIVDSQDLYHNLISSQDKGRKLPPSLKKNEFSQLNIIWLLIHLSVIFISLKMTFPILKHVQKELIIKKDCVKNKTYICELCGQAVYIYRYMCSNFNISVYKVFL